MRWSSLTLAGKLIILTLLALSVVAFGQDKPASPKPTDPQPTKVYAPTEVQSLRLQVRQKDALLAKATLEQAQRAFQQALTDLTTEGERVKTEQGWPHDTQFNPNDLTYSAPPVKDAKKEK